MKIIKDLGMKLPHESSNRKRHYVLCVCPKCENEVEIILDSIKSGTSLQCKKCANNEKKTHGLSKTRIHHIWSGILQRCNNENAEIYSSYGARGVTVCDEWLSFSVFNNWAINNNYNDILSLDRIDPNGNYEPKNCRWTTRLVQSQNQRLLNSKNTSGFKGVSFKSGKYEASISNNNKRIYLGRFLTPMEAAIAYNNFILLNNTHHTLNRIHNNEN